MKDELWMKKIKERLDDYSEPLPDFGWERLEKDLAASDAPKPEIRKIIPFRRWAVAVAAASIVAVSSISLWLLQSKIGDEVKNANVPALAVVPDYLPQQTLPSERTDAAEPLRRINKKPSSRPASRRSLVAQNIDIADAKEVKINEPVYEEKQPEAVVSDQTNVDQTLNVDQTMNVEKPAEEQVIERRRPSGKDKLHLPVERKSSSRSKGWSMGMSVANAGNILGSGGDHANPVYSSGFNLGRLDLSSTAHGLLAIPDSKEIVFKDGLPYLQSREKKIASIDHKQPLSFGISVRKNLPKGFSVETGLTYTYLSSDVIYEGSSEKVGQKLHYLGIPLRANWSFVDTKSFTMYLSGGGTVEKCVYAKVGSESESVNPIQLSVMGAVGAQYNISRRVGLYVEPGVSYFFDDGSSIQTIRKDNPFNFTLQAGLRLTY